MCKTTRQIKGRMGTLVLHFEVFKYCENHINAFIDFYFSRLLKMGTGYKTWS